MNRAALALLAPVIALAACNKDDAPPEVTVHRDLTTASPVTVAAPPSAPAVAIPAAPAPLPDPNKFSPYDVRAVELNTKDCDRNVMRACTDLASAYSHGKGVAEDVERAKQLYKKACDGDDTRGCTALGVLVGSSDPAREVELYRKSCDKDDQYACAYLGGVYQTGEGPIAKDLAQANKLLSESCDRDVAYGCTQLGMAYSHGLGLKVDPRRAAELYQKACDNNDGTPLAKASGCEGLAALYQQGRGVTKNKQRSLELYEEACDGGVAVACTAISDMKK